MSELMNEEDLIKILNRRFEIAEEAMIRQISISLYDSAGDPGRVIPESLYEKIKGQFETVFYWIKWRLVGTWRIWTKGECGECERDY